MASPRSTLVVFSALALATAAITSGLGASLSRLEALAQAPATPETFPIPGDLPADAVLNLDGSPSMTVANETFRQRFVRQFSNARVELQTSRTDEALQRLINGDLDVVASGRPLTEAERAEGLTEIPITREKIAIIVGPGNGFAGDLTFDQFVQMFLGDVTNWSAVGGSDVPVRFVDRPDHSDTRRALSQYDIFTERPFVPGATVDSVGDDATDAVVAALGDDGIGYAVVSQVQGRDDVRIVSMNGTLPDDPRYPYSQPRFYVYNPQASSPAALAFLGFVTTLPGQEIFAPGTAAASTTSAGSDLNASPADTTATGTAEANGAATALVPGDADGQGRLPWWLLGIPILGGLLWWLLKSQGGAPVVAPLAAGVADAKPSRIILTPRNCRRAYAYWEVPDAHRAQERDRGGRNLMLRLFEVTDRDTDRHPPARIDQFAVTEDQSDLHVPIPVDDRDYQVELGYVTGENHWLPLAKSDPVRVPICPVGEGLSTEERPLVEPVAEAVAEPVAESLAEPVPAMTIPGAAAIAGAASLAGAAAVAGMLSRDDAPPAPSRIILALRRAGQGYAYWEVPEAAKATAKRDGGAQYQLRIHTINLNAQPSSPPPLPIATYDLGELDRDHFVLLPEIDRSYVAEIGYATVAGGWHLLARSEPVSVAGDLETANLTDSSLLLTSPTDSSLAAGAPMDAFWTDNSPIENSLADNFVTGDFPTEDSLTDNFVPDSPVIGDSLPDASLTASPLINSAPVDSVPADSLLVAATTGAAIVSAASVAEAPKSHCTLQTLTVHSRHNAVLLDGGQMEHLQNHVAATYDLVPGSYILRIREGHFNYGDPHHPGEPLVLLWIYGGQVTNLKTNAKVNATWSTLNGYADTLSLEVDEPARLCAFFIDTCPDENLGEVTLSIVQL